MTANQLIAQNRQQHEAGNYEAAKHLDLRNCGLTDLETEVPELFTLVHLEELVLSANAEERTERPSDGKPNELVSLPATLSNLRKLQVFICGNNLHAHRISGKGISDISILSALTQLHTLDLTNNEISDISALQHLPLLTNLYLGFNQISDISALRHLSSLTFLSLHYNLISDISSLQHLPLLTELYLGSNQISDISSLQRLPFLTNLYLFSNKISNISGLQYLPLLTDLYLTNNQISDISSLQHLPLLTNLVLDSNQISDISSLQHLPLLTKLYLYNNKISDISSLQYLPLLTELHLGSNQISNISALQHLPLLTKLHLGFNKISDISALRHLSSLTNLHLDANQISDISALQYLPLLTNLDLFSNKISHISALQYLPLLTELHLGSNQISDISTLQHLLFLTILDLSDNQITDMSPLLPLLKQNKTILLSTSSINFITEEIGIGHNPLTTPPMAIVQMGRESVLNWFKQKEEQGTIKLYEAKIILVGEAGTGKTTLRKKLLDPAYPVPNPYDAENSTHGIEITPQVSFNFEPQPIMANIWDFGGQHNYYSTHRYFLTESAFYILVVDERRENTRFEYWFHIIDLLAKEKNSAHQTPILVLYNKRSGERMRNIDLNFYQEKFSALHISSIELDFAQKEWGHEGLLKLISENMGKLRHIGTEAPARWQAIRSELEKIRTQEKANYIDRVRYFDVCKQHGLTNTDDQLYLSSFLHRIGVVLHYQDGSDALARTIILNPDWAIDAIYAALSDREKVSSGCFRFEKSWLIDYWRKKGYLLDEYEVFLNLMFKGRFEIAYSYKDQFGTEWVIVPELLPAVPPIYELPADNLLYFRYEYEFMPEGLLTHFMVRMSEYIDEKDEEQLIWKNGVLLKKEDTVAEIRRLDLEGNRQIKFEIRLWGKEKEAFLKQIREEFDHVNRRFSGNLKPTELIPCICNTCKQAETPEYHDLSKLIAFEEKGKRAKECPESGEDVPLSGLLESYDRRESERAWEEEKKRLKEQINHLNSEKIKLESVLDNKGYLLSPTILQSIKGDIQNFGQQEYYAAAKSLYTSIENIANELLKQIGEDPNRGYRGLADKAQRLENMPPTPAIITHETAMVMGITIARNKLLHGNLAPIDQTCKPIAQGCMLLLANLIEQLQPAQP